MRFLPPGSEIYVRKDADGEEEEGTVPDGNDLWTPPGGWDLGSY